ncbi:MAG TPA: CRTAC1 family protein, partial [Bryobacteraceae bacterium]|nr:CRTAC1 family protein [Bryobacteraceae bacterium]
MRRLRRLAWTAGISLALAVACVWIGFALYQTSLPPSYEAGEDNPDVTRKYAQPYENAAKQATRQAPSPVAKQDDGLIKVDRPLPSGAPAPRFADVTAEAGLASFVAFSGTRTSQLPEDMGSGLAWGDFDNDGFDDLFLVSAGGALNLPPEAHARSELYRNLGNGTFSRVTDFPDLRILGMGAAWADCNNDGWLDLVVSGYDTLLLFRNEHGRFIRDGRFPNPKGFWTGVSWGDYDRDGWPDLYVCGYVQYKPQPGTGGLTRQFGLEVPYTLNPSSFEPARNLLFHNVHGSFTEVAAKLGVDNPDGRSLSALWQDFDDDGWPDLYVANDISESKLFLNRKGTFVDAGKQAWVSEYRGSMGLAAGDWDGDGDDDLFISHWVAQGYALYNSLLRDQSRAKVPESEQQPQLHFMDVAETYGIGNISLRYIGWGAEFVDFDSDGWLDLAVANGSTFETQGQPRKLVPMEAFLFWNNHGKFFFDLAPWNTSLSVAHVSRGLAVSDYDHDGAADIAIMNLDGGVRLLRNRIPQGNWIEFRLHSRTVGGALGRGEGARLIAEAGGRTFRRSVTTASYLSQSSRTVHLGLGQAPRVDALEVRWPDGSMQHFAGLAPNQIWDLTQGKGEALPWNPGAGGELLSRTQSPQHNVGSKQAEI